jgi:eukaryotic-like serine/threonine-protein kinase
MPREPDDNTTFPTYAELSQTSAWATAAEPVKLGSGVDTSTFDTRYAEQAVLGIGGMGKVVLANDTRIGREVAVKQMLAGAELGAEARLRFLREARVQGQLEHPSIVPVYDIDQREDGAIFFTMRRVLGHTLDAILADLRRGHSRYSQRELLGAFATVCLTIDYAHSRGVVHRDLKPANLMLGDFGEVYVLDWGLARLLDEPTVDDEPASRLSRPGMMMGTPLYMAPEQMADSQVGPAADVYSLGLILFEILTLQIARDPNAVHMPVDMRPSVRAPESNVAPELETICVQATAREPMQRLPSARAIQEAIAHYLDGDRALEQRRTLAAECVRAVQDALAAGDDGTAMHELVRALALDPTNTANVALLATIMATPPRTPPPEVEREVAASEQRVIRAGARDSFIATLAWFLIAPLLFAIGVVNVRLVIYTLVPVAAAVVLSVIALRRTFIGHAIQYGVIAATLVAMMVASRVFGPLVLGPTLIATYTLTIQIHPSRTMRRVVVVLAIVAMALPMVLELAGVLPSSYEFVDGRFEIVPQMLAFPKAGSIALLIGGSAVSMLLPAMFLGRVCAALSEAESRLLVQAWHLRRLGDEAIARAPR